MFLRPRISLANPMTWMVLIVFVWLFLTAVGLSAPSERSYGELLVARSATLNGTPAGSGLTLISGGRVKTGSDGRVTVNLGSLGLVKLGPDAEMVINFSSGSISSQLISGWAVFSSPKGVRISVTTPDGLTETAGAAKSLLTVDLTSGETRVESASPATVISGSQKQSVAANQALTVSRSTNNANPVFNRSVIGPEAGLQAPRGGLLSLLGSSLRGAVRTITLDQPLSIARSNSRTLVHSPEELRLNGTQQQATCPPFPCPGCDIDPDIVKARAKCTTYFIVRIKNVAVTSFVSVKPFFNSACFNISPRYPTQVQISPGGAAFYNIDGRFCPNNAGSLPQNSRIVIETTTCGTKSVQVEWAVPCR